MRYFIENLFSLHPQNLIPEALWMGGGLYLFVLIACFHSILHFSSLRLPGKVLCSVVVLIPFFGPLVYACYRLKTSESTLTEIWASRDKNVS